MPIDKDAITAALGLGTNDDPSNDKYSSTGAGISGNSKHGSASKLTRLAVVDPAYTSGNPKVTFEGESTLSGKTYACDTSYIPIPGDRVWMIPIGTTYLIAGRISAQRSTTRTHVFTTSGTYAVPTGVYAVKIRIVGGGGGSGGCATGTGQAASAAGAAGGYAELYILAANLLASETVTIGAAGTAGASGNNAGGTGGTSSFGSHALATGGGGGAGCTCTSGSVATVGGNPGGTGSSGDVNIPGDFGGWGFVLSGLALRFAVGGRTPLSGNAIPSGGVGLPNNGQAYGGGGAGVYTAAASAAGSAGAPGVVIIEEIYA